MFILLKYPSYLKSLPSEVDATEEGREYKSGLVEEVTNKFAKGAGLKTDETKSSKDVFSL